MHVPFGNQFWILLCCSGLLLSACGGEPSTTAPELPASEAETSAPRPHVVLIMLDTVRADRVGAYGHPEAVSPELDALAAEGVLFEQVLAQCSWTRPSVGSLLTSLYPRSLGIYGEREHILDDRFAQLAEVLGENGYFTAGFTANPNINTIYNFHQGFDTYRDSNVVFGWMDMEKDKVKRGKVSLPPAPLLFREALELVKTRKDGEPVYLQFNLMEIHEWVIRGGTSDMLRPEYRQMFAPGPDIKYRRLTRQLTDDVGAFVEELRALPGWGDALFIFMSDHGEGLYDHPQVYKSRYHGRLLYESQLVVPWIMFRGGWKPARARIEQPVRLLDLMPTVLAYLGIEGPAAMEGVSLMPVINGTVVSVPMPEFMVVETDFKSVDKTGVYSDEWLYIHNRKPYRGVPTFELQRRRGPQNGRPTDQFANQPEVTKAMQAYLAEWEGSHAKAAPTFPKTAITEEQREALRAIGYLDSDSTEGKRD